jgi:ketosteroid isomerase-like protein
VYKRRRRDFKRLFKSILCQYQGATATFVPMGHVGNTATEPLLANSGVAGSKCRVFHFPNTVGAFSGASLNVRGLKLTTRDISATSHIRLIARTTAEFHHCKFLPLPNAKYLVQIIGWGSSTAESANFLPIEGGYMKGATFAVVLLTVGCFSLPIFAQQQDLQEVMNAADALNARESELLSKKDAAGIASLFTSDGLLVMLAPQFAFKPGRDAIQKHYQGIIDAGTTSITLELKNLVPRGDDGLWAAGTYSITVKDKTIQGNWFRILKRESGNWKIAVETFARAGVIDAPPPAASSPPTPTDSK